MSSRHFIKKLGDTLDTNNARVIDEFKNFGKTLAESNSKALMDALTDAIKDFNQKMAEQFGENFKQFNVAVGRLLVWQENYKTTLETITHNIQIIIKGIDELRISIEQIENSAASMTESSEQIQNLILTANLYEQKLEQVLIQVQTLGESSQAAVPSIVEFVKSSCEEMQSYTEKATQDVNSYVSYVSRKYSDEIKTYTEQATQDVNSQMMKTNDENLKTSLETLGTAMLKISGKFVEDYTPLVNELKKIVEISKQVRLPAKGGGTLF